MLMHGLSQWSEKRPSSTIWTQSRLGSPIREEKRSTVPSFLAVWNLFGGIARSSPDAGASFRAQDGHLGALYEKLFWGNNLPAITPEGEHVTPEWSSAEVTSLGRVLREGLDLLVRVREAV